MLSPPRIEPGKRADKQLEEWIDQVVADGLDAREVAAVIATTTQPGGTPDEVSPELVGYEGWFWPWNRAGFLCLRHQRPADAATLFTCAYLAALRFQHAGQYRIHKGAPLCNISFAHLQADQFDHSVLPALLGMVEDAATSGNPTETASFQNLLAANFPIVPARSLAGSFVSLTRQRGLAPLYPEAVLESVRRASAFFSPKLVAALVEVADAFRPETVVQSLENLGRVWGELRPYINSMLDRRRTGHGKPATPPSITGSYALTSGGSAGASGAAP